MEFDDIIREIEPVHVLSESPAEQGLARLLSGLGACFWSIAVCGVLTWLGWVWVLVGKWVAG